MKTESQPRRLAPRAPQLSGSRFSRSGLRSVASSFASVVLFGASMAIAQPHALVLQSDFGLKDGAVAAMKGVAFGVDARLPIFDLSHENTPYDIWQGAYRLKQTAPYWPAGTVFVSVIDPGVGTHRKSVVLRTKSGHYFVSPDNGTLTLVAEDLGLEAVRQIDEKRNRLPGSEKSYTFHGRDVYAFTAARLASGAITFDEVGPLLPPDVVKIEYTRAAREGERVSGSVAVLDPNYGNVWTNIPDAMLTELGVTLGDRVRVNIARAGETGYTAEMPYVSTFGAVPEGSPLLYLNSLLNVSLALNQRNFAETHGIRAGGEWKVTIEKVKR
jgi:S-adenosylmethionine hydrolase